MNQSMNQLSDSVYQVDHKSFSDPTKKSAIKVKKVLNCVGGHICEQMSV